MKPRVSVITSIFKASSFLFDFLVDVKRQSIFSESQVLLLDANEDDEDLSIIEPFLNIPNFHYHRLGKCSVYKAWNKGIDLASSSIITNWNTDDRRSWNSLEKQVKFLEQNPNIDLCYGLTKLSQKPNENFEDCPTISIWPALEGTLENQLKHNSPHCLPVWRKDVHDRFGKFDESYFSAADYDMWFRILKGGGEIKKIEELIGVYYENPTSISRNPENHQRAVAEVMEIKQKYS